MTAVPSASPNPTRGAVRAATETNPEETTPMARIENGRLVGNWGYPNDPCGTCGGSRWAPCYGPCNEPGVHQHPCRDCPDDEARQ